MNRRSLLPLTARKLLLLGSLLAAAGPLWPATISGQIKDPSGAALPAASLKLSGPGFSQAFSVSVNPQGAFQTPDLPPGTYQLQFACAGFQEFNEAVTVDKDNVQLSVNLQLAVQRESVTVHGGPNQFLNSDPVYRQLRAVGLGTAFSVHEAGLNIDVAHVVFHDGTLRFLQPVEGRVTGAVFVGTGHLTLTPFLKVDRDELRRRSGREIFEEDFTQIVFRFTNDLNLSLLHLGIQPTEPDPHSEKIFSDWQHRVRSRSEEPLGTTQDLLNSEAMDNVDADVLASLYNPKHPAFLSAYIKGHQHGDLRFYLRYRGGAVPGIGSPEEVALVNFAGDGMDDGIFYLQHLKAEWDRHTSDSAQECRFFAVRKYTLDTYIAANNHLSAIATLDMQTLVPGERVVKFHLLPNLRVSKVTDGKGKDLYYLQQSRKEDGSFYVILDSPAQPDAPTTVRVEYTGDKVISDAGGGSFYIGARESWYPTPNLFNERSLYDLTFHVPNRNKIISVGKFDKEWPEDKFVASHWVTPSPVAIAGFNYGQYKMLPLHDDRTGTAMEGYYLPELPAFLRDLPGAQSLAPAAMTKHILEVTRAQLQICQYYFGPDGFDHIYITEQPNFTFGQSWPNLVYLPISAYTDSTQRYLLFKRIENRMTAFVDEVAPHEVAHQWWGHAVGWASYHDQWLSEGFAEFSAALFLQQAQGDGWESSYREFWDRLRKRILEQGKFGGAPNDAGPIWLGLRLTSPRDASAYFSVVYPKGAYILEMLRSLMYTNQDQDKNFIAAMHDFVQAHRDHPASTESFKAIIEKHMTPAMNLGHNGSLDWFFQEWVYGTEVPKYNFTYTVTPQPSGRAKLKMTLSQTGVSDSFTMAVPIFIEPTKGKWARIGQIAVTGNHEQTVDAELPVMPKSVKADALHEILQR